MEGSGANYEAKCLEKWMHFGCIRVLRSLPPSFKNYVRDYVMGRDPITFCEFVSRLRHVKVEPIAGEVVNAKGIYFDISKL